jgi:hypothetical protein
VHNVFVCAECTCWCRWKKQTWGKLGWYRTLVGANHRQNQTNLELLSVPAYRVYKIIRVVAQKNYSRCIKICRFPIQFHICWSPIRVILPVFYSVPYLSESNSSCIKICQFPIRFHICRSPIRVVLKYVSFLFGSISVGVEFELYYQFPIRFHIYRSQLRVVRSVSYSVQDLLLLASDCANSITQIRWFIFFDFLGLMWDFLGGEGEHEASEASRVNLGPPFSAQISI